jgi:hypothetical protein
MADREGPVTVLLVESDDDERRRLSAGLEEAGYDVLVCPGPTRPDYTCVGTRTLGCPLANGASVVVLDMDLEGDARMEGTTAQELLDVYLTGGDRVVALAPRLHDEMPGRLVRVRRRPDVGELAAAVRSLTARAPVERL